MSEFISTTIGLKASDGSKSWLTKVEFSRLPDRSVELKAVSGRNLSPIKQIKTKVLSAAEFADCPADPYDDVAEARWALGKLGLSICGDGE